MTNISQVMSKVSDLTLSNNPSGVSTNSTNGMAAAESKCNGMLCPACNLSFDSFDKLTSHALTLEHAQNVLKGNLNNNSVSSSSTAETNHVEDATSTTKDEILPGFGDAKKVQDLSSSRCNGNGKSVTGPEPYLQKNVAEVSLNSALVCETCKITCSGQIPYLQHMNSANHMKKLRQQQEIQKYTSEGISSSKLEESYANLNSVQVCETCKITCSGQIPYLQHMNSEAHKKKLRQLEEIQKYTSEGISSSKLEENNVSLNSMIVCETCKITCSGQIPYLQHMNSANHMKKLRQLQEVQKYTSEGISSSKLEESYANLNSVQVCETCKITCSGQIPYLQHMNSEAHKKKLRQLEEIQKYTSEVDSSPRLKDSNVHQVTSGNNNILFCKICDIQCSGVIPYEQHVRGASHLKNVRKAEISKNFLKPDDSFNIAGGEVKNIPGNSGNGILPNSVNSLDMVSAEILENSVKIFTTDEEIDFDKQNKMNAQLSAAANDPSCKDNSKQNESEVANESKESQDEVSGNIQPNISVLSEVLEKIDVDEKKVQECKICNVKLYSEEEVARHNESLEHFSKKWGSVRSE